MINSYHVFKNCKFTQREGIKLLAQLITNFYMLCQEADRSHIQFLQQYGHSNICGLSFQTSFSRHQTYLQSIKISYIVARYLNIIICTMMFPSRLLINSMQYGFNKNMQPPTKFASQLSRATKTQMSGFNQSQKSNIYCSKHDNLRCYRCAMEEQKQVSRQEASKEKKQGLKQKMNQDDYQIENRFKQIYVELPEIDLHVVGDIQEQLLIWLGEVCKRVLTAGFLLLKNQELTINRVKAYCSENIIRNILKFSSKYNLLPKHFQLIDKCLKNQLLPYFCMKYPQTEQKTSGKKFQNILIERRIPSLNEIDLIYKSGYKFEYESDGNYNSQIMQFLNYVIRLPNQHFVKSHEDGDDETKLTYFQSFESDVESIFKLIYKQENKISMLKFKPKSPQLSDKLDKSIEKQQQRNLNSKQNKERKQQQYLQKVKLYTSFSMGTKLSLDFRTFSDYQIQNGDFYLNNSAIMRLISKWCQQLQNCFDPKHILDREGKFRMKDGTENFLTKIHMEVLNLMLQREKEYIDIKLKQIKVNNYEHLSKFSNVEVGKSLHKFTESESIVGQYTSIIFKINENYLINYLNLLIAGINNAAQTFGKFRDYETYLDRQRQADTQFASLFEGQYTKERLQKVEKHIGQNSLSAKKAASKTPQLITFRIGDLMRCKLTSKQNEVIALYKHMQKISYKNPQFFKIIRIKNKLDEGNKDILINLLYRQSVLVQMQLAIKSDKSKFIECTNPFNHYFYELKRARFGAFAEMCIIFSSQDLRSPFYLQKLGELTNRTEEKNQRNLDGKVCCYHNNNTKVVRLPFTCSVCKCLQLNCYFSKKHIFCQKCKKYICILCQIETFPKQMMRKLLPALYNLDKFNLNQLEFCKKIPEKGGGIINLKAKNQKLLLFSTIKHKGEIYLFYQSSKKKDEQFQSNLIYKTKSKNLSPSFLKQNLILRIPCIEQLIPEYSVSQAELSEFIPQYLLSCHRSQSKSIFLMGKQLNKEKIIRMKKQNKNMLDLKWKSVESLNLSENQFTELNNLPVMFPNVKSLVLSKTCIILDRNQFKELSSLSISNWANLKELYLSHNNISNLQPIVDNFKNLTLLDVSTNKIRKLPANIGVLKTLRYFDIMENLINQLDNGFYELCNLKTFRAKNNSIVNLSESLCKMQALTQLEFTLNDLQNLPQQFGKLKSLQNLSVMTNQRLKILPWSFGQLENLSYFQMRATSIKKFPQSFGSLKNLVSLHCGNSLLEILPLSFGSLASLTQMYITNTKIKFLPKTFGDLKCLQILFMSHSQLQALPDSFGNLKSLKQLRISETKIKALPANFGSLQNLRQLFMNELPITTLPETFSKLHSLTRLQMNKTALQELPNNFGDLQQLNILSLSRSNVSSLPPTFYNLRELNSLDLSYNPLENLSQLFGCLENLSQLSLKGIKNLTQLPQSFINLHILKRLDLSQLVNLDIRDTLIKIKNMETLENLKICVENIEQIMITMLENNPSPKILQIFYLRGKTEELADVCNRKGIKLKLIKSSQENKKND